MKELLRKIWKKIKKAFKKIDDALKDYVPVAINICEALKQAVSTGVYDTVAAIVEAVIPGEAENEILAKFKIYLQNSLPEIIANLQLVDILAEIDKSDIDTQMQTIITYMQGASNDAQDAVYAALSAKLLEYFDDGELTKAERHALIEWYYTTYVKE
jgi:hypothetical protein